MHLESYPKDNDPYCPGRLNYFLSHYNQLANLPQEPYQSETSSKIVSELHGNKILIAESNKSLINFYSYSKFDVWYANLILSPLTLYYS